MNEKLNKAKEELSKKIFFAYGFQEFAFGFLTNMGVQYFPYFLTDVALIAPAIVGTILLIGRIVDTVSVLVTGIVVEKSNLPWGKYRSWLFVAAPLVVVFNMLMFSNFDVSTGVQVAYLTVAYIVAYFFVNLCSTARFSLLPTFTNDPQERAKLSARRGQGQSLSQVVRGAVIVPLVAFLGGGSEARGYFLVVTLFGVVVIAGLYYLAYLAKDYDKPQSDSDASDQPTLKEIFHQIFTNKPLLYLLAADTFRYSATMALMTLGMYYFKYVVGNLMLFSVYLPISFAGGFVGNSISEFITSKVEKKKTYLLGIAIWMLGMFLVCILAGDSAPLFIAFVTIAQFGIGISNATVPAFFSDTADYGEYKTGKSVRAVNMGLVILPIKLGVAIGGALGSYGLALIGFQAGTSDPNVINNIRVMISVMPIIVAILSIVFMYFYNLDNDKMEEIQEKLANNKT